MFFKPRGFWCHGKNFIQWNSNAMRFLVISMRPEIKNTLRWKIWRTRWKWSFEAMMKYNEQVDHKNGPELSDSGSWNYSIVLCQEKSLKTRNDSSSLFWNFEDGKKVLIVLGFYCFWSLKSHTKASCLSQSQVYEMISRISSLQNSVKTNEAFLSFGMLFSFVSTVRMNLFWRESLIITSNSLDVFDKIQEISEIETLLSVYCPFGSFCFIRRRTKNDFSFSLNSAAYPRVIPYIGK